MELVPASAPKQPTIQRVLQCSHFTQQQQLWDWPTHTPVSEIHRWKVSSKTKYQKPFLNDYWLLCYLYPLGDVELKVHIVAFQFNSSPSQDAVLLMDGETPLERILDIVSGDITFTGCGLCCAELDTDENGIYRPCYPCLPHTGVRRYYRYCNTFQLIDVGFCLTIYAHIYLAVCLSGRLQLCANVASSFFFFFFIYLYTIHLSTYIIYLLIYYLLNYLYSLLTYCIYVYI